MLSYDDAFILKFQKKFFLLFYFRSYIFPYDTKASIHYCKNVLIMYPIKAATSENNLSHNNSHFKRMFDF